MQPSASLFFSCTGCMVQFAVSGVMGCCEHTSGYRLLSFSGVTSTPRLAVVAIAVRASTSFINANTFAAADAIAMMYTVFTSRYTTRYLQDVQDVWSRMCGPGCVHPSANTRHQSAVRLMASLTCCPVPVCHHMQNWVLYLQSYITSNFIRASQSWCFHILGLFGWLCKISVLAYIVTE